MSRPPPEQTQHRTSRAVITGEAISVVAAVVLLMINTGRFATTRQTWVWWIPLVAVAAWPTADLVLGVVH